MVRPISAVLRRAPIVRRLFAGGVDLLAQSVLFGMRLRHPRPPRQVGTPAADTTALNRAADEYFRAHQDVSHLLEKPFSEPAAFSRRLIELGTLVGGLRLAPGDTVLELGAGACWVSHFLNRIGCRTIAVDVSRTALALGRELFERDRSTDWSLHPMFVAYDGHTLPVRSGSVDAIVLYDAFHHLPNPGELLAEMRRVLTPDGLVGMSEPGRGHASSAPSRAESAGSGVLESELVMEEIAEQALAAGFGAARCLVAPSGPLMSIDAKDLRRFMGGRGLSQYWSELCAALDSHYFVILSAGDPTPSSARPGHLKAVLARLDGTGSIRVNAAGSPALHVSIRNVGDTRWLAAESARRHGRGWTRLGAHLFRGESGDTLLDYDWFRCELPRDVGPGESVEIRLVLPPIHDRGTYLVAIDLLVEQVAWFGDRESQPLYVVVTVGA